MALSNEMRRLQTKWATRNGWPKRMEWLEIRNMRGWKGQRIGFDFPIVAIVGENGSGKSTILQASACVYQQPESHRTWFPSEFFPETAWESFPDARITFGYAQGQTHATHSIRKPTTRWLGQPDRPIRRVEYIDLSRLQPVGTRVGYASIAKNKHREDTARALSFTDDQVRRLSQIMGREYDNARMAYTNIDENRQVPILSKLGVPYSGFHQGSGETTMAELLRTSLPQYGLIIVDEIESSLHPRAQRRLMRDLAVAARERECQIIISTHSPYVLEELPLEARTYILETGGEKEIANGVSPQFAMTQMDDEQHAEAELFVEDPRAATWLSEILSRHDREAFVRCTIIPYGSANLGVALGQMVEAKRFPRPTLVFLDGDQGDAPGCMLLPGGDAPERVVFERLRKERWRNLWSKVGRDISAVTDACERAMTLADHHEWITAAANQLFCGGDVLWQAMCSEWAEMVNRREVLDIIERVDEVLA